MDIKICQLLEKLTANVSCQLNFRRYVSCQLKFWPFVSCQSTPSRPSVLNDITFLTKTKLSRQVRDILKKTKGVIIITIALPVLLASWYISRHGRLVQKSNNQAGPRGEKY